MKNKNKYFPLNKEAAEKQRKLLEAAPLLLEAVKGMYASLAWHIDNHGHYGMDQKRMDDARAAIAATQQ